MTARPEWTRVAVAALVACGAGCLNAVPPDGVLCGTSRRCPSGFYCAGDDRCYHDGVIPDLAGGDFSSSPDDAGGPVDLLCIAPSGCGNCAPPNGSPTAVVLSFVWQGEEQTYWDGPASTRIALSTRMASPPSQTEIASYIGTTTSGTIGVSVIQGALNHYLVTNWFELKYISDPPSTAERDLLKRDVLFNLPEGYPIVANVISGWRPGAACYPGGNIDHYVAIVGYDQGGDQVLIVDPGAEGAGGSGWSTVTRSYWISLADLAVWIGGAAYTA